MNYRCPKCNHDHYHFHGSYFRKSDSKNIERFKCVGCRHVFSRASFSNCYRQHKRRVNPILEKLLSSGVSGRRSAIILRVSRNTIAQKIKFLAKLARLNHKKMMKNLTQKELSELQLDDLITSHHTKLKPLSLSVVVSKKSRKILGATLSQIPAFGHLARHSLKKYGPRPNELPQKLDELFSELSRGLPRIGTIESDEHKLYPPTIKKYLKDWTHFTHKGKRATIAGLGEMKLRDFDPLFTINHTLAWLRANMNRLFRRTWNTTKSLDYFMDHFWIFANFHNNKLLRH